MAQSDKLQSLTVERYKELSEAMSEHEIAKHLDTTIHYIKKWKKERGLVEKRKTTKDTAQTSIIDRTATEQVNHINSYAEEIKTLKEENKELKACADKKGEEVQRLHNRIELLEQQLSEKQKYEQFDIKLPKDLPDAVTLLENGYTVDLVDIELRKRTMSTIRFMGQWLDIKHFVPARLAKKD